MTETSSPFSKEPLHSWRNIGGPQYIFSFENGYGASVVQNPFSYGNKKGLWELAVITFDDEDKTSWSLTYSTPITDDVIGWQTVDGINETLSKIERLPSLKKEQTK